MRRRPPPLRTGDRVACVAPAGPVPAVLAISGVSVLTEWDLDWSGLDRVAPGALPHLAADDATRARAFQQAWCDREVRAVFCMRGGYGTQRMLDLLDWDALAAAEPTLLVGSSDVTALHTELGARCDVVTLFAPMLATEGFVEHPRAQEHLRAALFEPPAVIDAHPGAATVQGGTARGPTVGGTLSLLVTGLGVPSTPAPPDGAIVLLEDVTEAPYRIDQYLTQLLRAGWFDRAAGIVCGSWQHCGEPARVHEVLLDRLGPLGVPFVTEFGFGHCPDQLTVPLGETLTLDADARLLRR